MNGQSIPGAVAGVASYEGFTPGASGRHIAFPKPGDGERHERAVRIPLPQGVSRDALRQQVDELLLMLALDQSGSIFSVDPGQVRAAAARSLVDLHRRLGAGQAAVLHWGSGVPEQHVHGPLDTRRAYKQLLAFADSPGDLGGTSIGKPVLRMSAMIRTARGIQRAIGFLITDATTPTGVDVDLALATWPANAELHAILINAPDGLDEEWGTRARFASVTALTDPSVRELSIRIGELYAAALGAFLPTRSNQRNWP